MPDCPTTPLITALQRGAKAGEPAVNRFGRLLARRWPRPAAHLARGFLLLAFGLCLASDARAGRRPTLESLQAAAQRGDARASYELAKRYSTGDGVPQDDAKVVEYLRQAAAKGQHEAQNDLGSFYARGRGVKPDLAEALKWYRRSAEGGEPLGEYNLGHCCELGRGLGTNLGQAVLWYKRAARHSQIDALLCLGDIYLKGRPGIPPDARLARKWLDRAGAQGNGYACNCLGDLYEQGRLMPRDFKRAARYYRLAAEKGYGEGQFNFARMLISGTGTKKDVVESCKWLSLAGRNGQGSANLALNDAIQSGLITPDQADEGVRRADEYRKRLKGGKPLSIQTGKANASSAPGR
jgi:hypothetical protein